eukprot:Opistho-2@32130
MHTTHHTHPRRSMTAGLHNVLFHYMSVDEERGIVVTPTLAQLGLEGGAASRLSKEVASCFAQACHALRAGLSRAPGDCELGVLLSTADPLGHDQPRKNTAEAFRYWAVGWVRSQAHTHTHTQTQTQTRARNTPNGRALQTESKPHCLLVWACTVSRSNLCARLLHD